MKSRSFFEDSLHFLLEQRLLLIFVLLGGAFIVARGQALSSSVPAGVSTAQVPDSCPVRLNFDGAWEQGLGWGASAIIGGYQPGMWCSDDSIWSMITNPNYPPTQAYAQIGYSRGVSDPYTTVNSYFLEYTYTTGGSTRIYLGIDTSNWGGSSDTFVVYYDSSTHLTKFLIDNNLQYSVQLDWSATQMQWFNETHSSNDQVLGGYNHHTVLANVQYLRNGAWHQINAQTDQNNDNPNGSISPTPSGKFWIWDKRVP